MFATYHPFFFYMLVKVIWSAPISHYMVNPLYLELPLFPVSVPFLSLASRVKCGPHTTIPYSRCGRAIALNNFGNVLWSSTSKDLFIKPSMVFAFFIAYDECSFYIYNVGFCFQNACLHFVVLNDNSLTLDHIAKVSTSFCNNFDSSMLFTSRYTFVSSENSFVVFVKSLVKSLMYITNSSGPRTEPYGMSLITFSQEDGFPSITTLCLLLLKNDCIHCSMSPFIPKVFTFEISLLSVSY